MDRRTKKTIGIICAKSHSNRFKNKNLILWKQAFNTLLECNNLSNIVVASDFHISEDELKGNTHIHRPMNASMSEDSLINVIKFCYYSLDKEYDYIACLFANSVGNKSIEIDSAINMIEAKGLKEVRGFNEEGDETGLIVFDRGRLINEGISSYIGSIKTSGKEIHYEEELKC